MISEHVLPSFSSSNPISSNLGLDAVNFLLAGLDERWTTVASQVPSTSKFCIVLLSWIACYPFIPLRRSQSPSCSINCQPQRNCQGASSSDDRPLSQETHLPASRIGRRSGPMDEQLCSRKPTNYRKRIYHRPIQCQGYSGGGSDDEDKPQYRPTKFGASYSAYPQRYGTQCDSETARVCRAGKYRGLAQAP